MSNTSNKQRYTQLMSWLGTINRKPVNKRKFKRKQPVVAWIILFGSRFKRKCVQHYIKGVKQVNGLLT